MDFMDKFVQRISKGTKTLSEKADEMIELAELKLNIKDIEDEIENAKAYIGELVYKHYLNKNIVIEELNQKCHEIEFLYKELYELRERINHIMGYKYCNFCGEFIMDEEKYCSGCGRKIAR